MGDGGGEAKQLLGKQTLYRLSYSRSGALAAAGAGAPDSALGTVFRLIPESNASTCARDGCGGVGIIVDLQGPKIRLGRFSDGSANLVYGDRFTITTRAVPGDKDLCSTTYDGLPGDVRPGDRTLGADKLLATREARATRLNFVLGPLQCGCD